MEPHVHPQLNQHKGEVVINGNLTDPENQEDVFALLVAMQRGLEGRYWLNGRTQSFVQIISRQLTDEELKNPRGGRSEKLEKGVA